MKKAFILTVLASLTVAGAPRQLPVAEPEPVPPPTAAEVREKAAREWRLLARELARKDETRPIGQYGMTSPVVSPKFRPPADQVVNRQALVWDSDRDPLDVVLRRMRALADDLKGKADIADAEAQLASLEGEAARTDPSDDAARFTLFTRAVRVRRTLAFRNPLVSSIRRLLFITRPVFAPREFDWGVHLVDQFFGFHAKGKETMRASGLYVLHDPFTDRPRLHNILQGRKVESGAWKGRELIRPGWWDADKSCGFLSPDVSWDGTEILFCASAGRIGWNKWPDDTPFIRQWTDETVFHIFKCNADGSGLVQVTEGSVNDLFPCWLPNGRVAFCSERRGGFGRCHSRPCPTYTLHTMFPDGTDITCISPHETNEFEPSVDNDGMLVYMRWDYVDRGFNQAHHGWIAYPDGRDPRELNGNTRVYHGVAPHATESIRAIPGSHRYVATACGHHTLIRGSLVLLDPSVPDDGMMSQVKRLTPDQLFPESEAFDLDSHHSGAYGTAWPLSETYYICVYDGDANCQYGPIYPNSRKYALVLLDAFGNKVEIFDHPEASCLDPMPLQARPMPPVIPHKTLVGRPADGNGVRPEPIAADKLPKTAEVALMNVYNSRYPFPEGVTIKELRIWQILPKVEFEVGKPRLGACDQTPGRRCLGTVPVEADGSARFNMPVGVPVYFQALDENGCAVQTMRSDTYAAPGERLSCNGCHEARSRRVQQTPAKTPIAMGRPPSAIKPEVAGSNPFNYPRLVQPVLDAKCVSCHSPANPRFDKARMPDLATGDIAKNRFNFHTSYIELTSRELYQYYTKVYKGEQWLWRGPKSDDFVQAFSEPGKVGARASRLYEVLGGPSSRDPRSGKHHGVRLTDEEWRRLTLFMDAQGAYISHDHKASAQCEGAVVQPVLE